MSETTESGTGPRRRTRLVVVVPSVTDQIAPWDDLVDRLKGLPGYSDDVCKWHRTHHGGSWSRPGSAAKLGERLAANIHEQWVANGGYDSVVLVGHSLGGMLTRYAYLHALGVFNDQDKLAWADAVERVVLFASLNRGIEVSVHRRWWLPTVAWLGRVLPYSRHWLAHDVLRASTFVTNLRIAWLRAINSMPRPPVMVQYLGEDDDLVKEEDSRDIETFATGTQILIPGATHSNLIRLDTATDPDARFALIADAFTEPRPDHVQPQGDTNKQVVIVLHGIRASNDDWPRQLEKHIETAWPGTEVIAATYGRFSARKFMIPATRRRFLSWMQDTYAEQLAANPRATFHFIGHSNGTYLLGHSLEHIPAMRFERIVLAGSVLPQTYDWQSRRRDVQFGQLRNHRASRDIPVGVLCAALHGLFMRDIGTGGVYGFNWEDPSKKEFYYYDGGHSAALAQDNLPHLASFVMTGKDQPLSAPIVAQPTNAFSLLSRAAPVLSWLIVLALAVAGLAFLQLMPLPLILNLVLLLVILFTVFLVLDIV
jgi:pimeloyl-ACP methyl ester carboxylesterase